MKNMFVLLAGTALAFIPALAATTATLVKPAEMPRMGTVDERFQSYNVEMVEVTGGVFWKPYEQMKQSSGQKSGGDVYAAAKGPLPPIDLTDKRLRKLAAALGPAYVRVSGSEANAVYFHDDDAPPPSKAPKGFRTVLTRAQWKNVVDFARAVNGKIVTSFAVSEGVRDAQGRWVPDQARALMNYTKSLGGEIAAAELVNEPNLAPAGAVYTPPGYDVPTFARDFAAFRQLAAVAAPGMLVLGPSSTSEGVKLVPEKLFRTEDLLTATPTPVFDVFSYHAYGASSIRCTGPGRVNTTVEEALTGEWLDRVDVIHDFYAPLRDRYARGKPMWVTETAQSSCGGDPWAKTYIDSFRYLDHLGRNAQLGVQVSMHNTLAVSEYGLIDRQSMTPRPNYWAALLWRRLMGTTVLDPVVPVRVGFHVYAHCLRGVHGGVALLAINTSRDRSVTLDVPNAAERYSLSAKSLDAEHVQLNGKPLELQENGDVPQHLVPQSLAAGKVELAPATITFLAMPDARNPSCP
jgi:heparanase